MKALFGIASLLVVLGIVSLLVKKQLPTASTPATQAPAQQVQQIRQQVEAALQQPRTTPDDK